MDHSSKCKTQNDKTPDNTEKKNSDDLGFSDGILDMTIKM